MEAIKKFVAKHLLRKNEVVEWIRDEGDTLFAYIARRTPRTYRRLARLLIANKTPSSLGQPSQDLLKKRMSIHRAKPLSLPQDIIRKWISEGWIVQKVNLSDDGRTSLSTEYFMGPTLYKYMKRQEQLERVKQENTFESLQASLKKHLHTEDLLSLQRYIQKLLTMDLRAFEKDPLFENWSRVKRMRFLEFFIALLSIRAHKKTFDFKEIGAFYYREIGGSKAFDRYREDFISLLEYWLGEEIESIGLISQGKIMPIFFSGRIEGKYATFHEGSLHAVTDVALVGDRFKTNSKVLWLVENRAMLTRMNASKDFIKATSSLIVCLDGHIRSAQRNFIQQISQSESIEQVIIWTDYDPSGIMIAKEAYEILDPTLLIKWIAADGKVYFDLEEYVTWYKEEMKSTKREQEEVLGDEALWKKWIKM